MNDVSNSSTILSFVREVTSNCENLKTLYVSKSVSLKLLKLCLLYDILMNLSTKFKGKITNYSPINDLRRLKTFTSTSFIF